VDKAKEKSGRERGSGGVRYVKKVMERKKRRLQILAT
jgi:hypothetical protein